jgi:hypothetical protein
MRPTHRLQDDKGSAVQQTQLPTLPDPGTDTAGLQASYISTWTTERILYTHEAYEMPSISTSLFGSTSQLLRNIELQITLVDRRNLLHRDTSSDVT